MEDMLLLFEESKSLENLHFHGLRKRASAYPVHPPLSILIQVKLLYVEK